MAISVQVGVSVAMVTHHESLNALSLSDNAPPEALRINKL